MSGPAPYVTDIDYTARYYPEVAPAHVAFALAMAGQDPGRSAAPRRVLELGCGRGFGLALLAAANPDVLFEGCDFNARHAAEAQGLGDAAGLGNLSVEVASFTDLAARGGAADVDLAIVHGVMAWVDEPTRRAVMAILDARLAEGGVAFVSYNCEPGWAALDPLRQVARAVVRAEPDPSRRVPALLDWLGRLDRGGAAAVAGNPVVARHVRAMAAEDPAYLAHQWLGTAARALAVDEVHGAFAPLGLHYAASATVAENIDGFALPLGIAALVGETDDPLLRETLRDLGGNRSFRRDLFRRGAGSPSAAAAALDAAAFALVVPAREVDRPIDGPLGPVVGHPHLAPVAARLCAGTARFAELLRLPPFDARGRAALVEALSLLVHAGRVAPVMRPPADPAPAHRFNRSAVESAAGGTFRAHLACPSTRAAVAVEDLELLVLASRPSLGPPNGEAMRDAEAARIADVLRRLGRHPYACMTVDDIRAVDARMVKELFPLFGALSVLPHF